MDRSTPPLGSLYQELILEHYKQPRNRGTVAGATSDVHLNKPTCGDEIHLQLRVGEEGIEEARFEGQGCSISQASASMMTQLVTGKTREEALQLTARFKELMHGDESAARDRALGDLRALAGVSKFPARVRCALLSFNALEDSLK